MGANINTIDDYEHDIKGLSVWCPLAWDLVVVADEAVRNERWETLHDEYQKHPPKNWVAKRPWDACSDCKLHLWHRSSRRVVPVVAHSR